MELKFSLTTKVANHIRRMIELQKLFPGDVVPLDEIEEALSVSRTQTRDAIRQLELEHLVAIEPGRGADDSPVSAGEILNLYQFRMDLKKSPRASRKVISANMTLPFFRAISRITPGNQTARSGCPCSTDNIIRPLPPPAGTDVSKRH